MIEYDYKGNKVEVEIININKDDIETIISNLEHHQNFRLTYKSKKHCLNCGLKGDIDGWICPKCRTMSLSDTETEVCAKTKDIRIKNGGLICFSFESGTKRFELDDIVEIKILGKIFVVSQKII